jgi:hypothetical protein
VGGYVPEMTRNAYD